MPHMVLGMKLFVTISILQFLIWILYIAESTTDQFEVMLYEVCAKCVLCLTDIAKLGTNISVFTYLECVIIWQNVCRLGLISQFKVVPQTTFLPMLHHL